MNANENRELREQRAKIYKDMVDLKDSTSLKTAEERGKWDAMDKDVKELTERITRMEQTSAYEQEFRATGKPPAGQPNGGADDPEVAAKVKSERHKRAFRSYLTYGSKEDGGAVGRMNQEDRKAFFEYRDMGTSGQAAYPGITSGAGIFVPVGFVDRITEALKYYGPMLVGGAGNPDIMETATGQPLPFPTDNDTTQTGEIIGEGQQVNMGDVTIGQVILGAYKFSSKLVKVSIELLQDSAFDIETYLIKKLATRTGRILNTKFTIGSGTNEPTGIIVASTSGGATIGTSGNDGTSAGANSIGSDDLTTLEHSVDPLYRRGAKYMFHDATLAALKKVKDKYGRPLWLPSVQVNAPDTLNGYMYLINNDMDQLQANAGSPPVQVKPILFGDLSLYQIRRVKEMSILRLEERFADQGQIAFIGFSRYDANLLDAGTHPVKYLTATF